MISLRNLGVVTAANAGNALLAFVSSIIAARALSSAEFGRLSVLVATSTVVVTALDLGINQILTGRVAKRPRTRLFADTVWLRMGIAVAATLALAVALLASFSLRGRALTTSVEEWLVVLASASWILVFSTDQAQTQGRQQFKRLAWSMVFVGGVRAGAIAVVGAVDARYEPMLAAYLLPPLVAGAFTVYTHSGAFSRRRRLRLVRSLLPVIGLAGATVVLTAALPRIGMWALALLRGDEAVATYAVAFQVASLVLTFGSALSLTFLPKVAELDRAGAMHDVLERYLRKALPLAVLAVIAAGALSLTVPIVFGARYAGSVGTTFFLTAGFVISVLNGPFYLLQVARLRYAFLVKVHTAQAVVLAAGCLALIPRWGAEGAALAEVLMRVGVVAAFITHGLTLTRREASSRPERAVG